MGPTRWPGALLLTACLTACTTTSDVVPIGEGRYFVGYQVRGGMTSWGEVKASAIKQATSFCASKGLKVDVINVETHGAQGWTPQNADVTFRCMT